MGKLDNLPADIKFQIIEELVFDNLSHPQYPPELQIVDIKAREKGKVILPPNERTWALYNFGTGEIAFDEKRFQVNFLDTLLDVLHEVEHRNQFTNWTLGTASWRKMFVSNYQLPEEVEKVRNNPKKFDDALRKIDLYDLYSFWNKVYGYESNPLERLTYSTQKNIRSVVEFAYLRANELLSQKNQSRSS